MKKYLMTLALVVVAMSAVAQDKLLYISPENLEWRKDEPKLNFHDKEIARLLIPETATFGMIHTSSSFFPERVLSYDSKTKKLFWMGAKSQIWKAMSQPFEQNDMSLYQAPDVLTCALDITDYQAQKLETLWRHAIETSADIPDNMLDGATWKFFMGDRQAKARHDYNPMAQFATQIAHAVSDSDAVRLDFIITYALDKTIERMDRLPAEEDPALSQRCQMVDTLVVVDGKAQPQSLNYTLDDWKFNVVKEYFAKQKRRVWSARRYYRRPLMQRDYAEQYGIIARNLIIEYTTVPERFSMEEIEGLSFVTKDEPLQGPRTGLDIVGTIFEVDKDLPAPKKTITKFDDKFIAAQIINVLAVPSEDYHVLKTSFEGQQLAHMGKDNFYKCILQAYADHRPLVLSPDMVWLIISQGFSRYVNAHTEEMRDLLVSHEGKMELVTVSDDNILLPGANWEGVLNDFSACIARETKGELADLMTADFTTTGITERIASQISLMDVVKEYFIYTRISAICGIPSITLKGTPDDWQKVLDKARRLRKYNLEKWSDDLVTILKEFVEASKGKANKKFWQNIVSKRRVDQINIGRGCLPDPKRTTYVDGWILKFFPNADGVTSDSVMWSHNMPQEMVRVNFQQVLTDPATELPIDTIPVQLWSGFVGVEENATTHALTPKIGWLARIGDEESDEVGRMKEQNKYDGSISIELGKGQEVPRALSKLEHIRTLRLNFWNSPVIIPEWLDNIPIDKLHIMGKFTDEEETQLRQRFPNVMIERVDDIFKSLKPLPADQKTEKPPKAGDYMGT